MMMEQRGEEGDSNSILCPHGAAGNIAVCDASCSWERNSVVFAAWDSSLELGAGPASCPHVRFTRARGPRLQLMTLRGAWGAARGLRRSTGPNP